MEPLRVLLRERKFTELLVAGQKLLATAPDQRDALLFVAIAQRHLGRTADALKTLAVLEQHHPRFSRLYEERGRCFVDSRDAAAAIRAFSTAVSLNHALPGSWGMLESLYRMMQQPENAATAASQVAALRKVPREIVTATGLFADGDLEQAESLIRHYLLAQGNHIEAMRLLARIGIARQVFDDAELLLAAVLELAPEYGQARQEYAGVLIEQHKYEEARVELERLLAHDPDSRDLRTLFAASCVGVGEHERAIELYRALLQGTAGDAEVRLSIAHALKTLGRSQEAVESYRQAAACRPDFGDAYWSLANLKTYRFTDLELTDIRAALAAPGTQAVDRCHLSFALGKALEDGGEFERAFGHYLEGNRLKRAGSHYRPEIIETNTRQQIEVCTAELFAQRRGWGAPSPDPIFIVGLPRSGSTLIEQILASHSQVEGTQELPNIQQIVRELRGRDPDPVEPRYPGVLAELERDRLAELGEQYLRATRIYRTGGRPFFIDKMPNNFRHIGLIHLMLPNARIIDARREPMACCFSNFKQLFANGQEFTYDLEDIARYYRTYLELMRHWDEVLPGHILRVYHEDVVEDLDASVRRLLEFCGLPFEPQCVAFHKNRRSVRTASSEQVRQAIYRDGLDQWQRFEPWLGPLENALGDALERYRSPKEALPAPRRTPGPLPQVAEANANLGAGDVDTLIGTADDARALGRVRESVVLYQQALQIDPDSAEAHNNLGNAFLELGECAAAAGCYRAALRIRPGIAEVHCNLGNALRQLGELQEALECSQRALQLEPRLSVAHNNLGLCLVALGQRAEAVASYQQALRQNPQYADALDNLGNVLRELGQRQEALLLHQKAVTLDPARARSHRGLGDVLFEMRRLDEAEASYRRALSLQPGQSQISVSLAAAMRMQGRVAAAQAVCEAVLAENPGCIEALCLLGELHADAGRFSQAHELFARAIALDPTVPSALCGIAAHRRMTRADTQWLQNVQGQLAKPLPLSHEINLHYAVGKYSDDIGEYDQAFAHYRQANELTKRYGAHYSRNKLTQRVDRIIDRFDTAFIRRCQAHGSVSEQPVFVVGMPRSGTSLIEQIAASHPAVFGAGELRFWEAAFAAFDRAGFEDKDSERLIPDTGRDYLARLQLTGAAGALRVIDKMPANFLYAGLIHAVFPRARIIHMPRHPIDTCLSIYFQNFFGVNAYANDLEDLAHYYSEYERVTAHWRAQLPPTAWLEIAYEALVADQETWTRRLLEFLGLPWDPRCLEFHRTERVVITASKWQVRQKMHTGSTGRWRHYEKHIAPLRELTGNPIATPG